MVSVDRCNGSCNTFDDLSSTICVSSKWNKNIKKKIFHVIVNVNLVLENVIEIKSRMTKSVRVSLTFSTQKKLCSDS